MLATAQHAPHQRKLFPEVNGQKNKLESQRRSLNQIHLNKYIRKYEDSRKEQDDFRVYPNGASQPESRLPEINRSQNKLHQGALAHELEGASRKKLKHYYMAKGQGGHYEGQLSRHLSVDRKQAAKTSMLPDRMVSTKNHHTAKRLLMKNASSNLIGNVRERPTNYTVKPTEFRPPHLHTQERFDNHHHDNCAGCQLAEKLKREDAEARGARQ